MIVRLNFPWFAPTDPFALADKRSTSGILYRRGEHELSDDMLAFLPSSAEILSAPTEKEPEEEKTLKDYDLDRANAEALGEIVEAANKTRGRPKKAE